MSDTQIVVSLFLFFAVALLFGYLLGGILLVVLLVIVAAVFFCIGAFIGSWRPYE